MDQQQTPLQKALNGQKNITALKDKLMHIHKTGKVSYVNLLVADGTVYAASIKEDLPIIGKAMISNPRMLGKEGAKKADSIKITQSLPDVVIGEIVIY